MTTEKTDGQPAEGSRTAAISTAIVQLVRKYTGRGPTRARTSIRDNVVVVLLEDSMTTSERSLIAHGRTAKVLEVRAELQDAMREEARRVVAEITGRDVIAMLSANHAEPDLAAEIFVLQDGERTGSH